MPRQDISTLTSGSAARKIVSLTVTEDCNLRCRYCYEPNKDRNRYMTPDVARQAIEESMRGGELTDEVEFDFFGGEPMLAFDLIQDTVDWFHTREWPKRHLFFVCTNGTILTPPMQSWLVKNKRCVQVSVSLDGNKIAHDLNRCNSYDRVMQNMPFFSRHWPNQWIKMTISAETIPYVADSVISLEGLGLPFSANIVFEDIWGSAEQKAHLLETYAEQLDVLVAFYASRRDLFPARMLDVRIESISERDQAPSTSADSVRFCGAGHEMVCVNVDGSRSPCHRFAPWVTGRKLADTQANHQFTWKPDKCSACVFNHACPTCAGYNWQVYGESGTRTTYHCEAFQLEAQASAKLQALRLLQQSPKELAYLPPKEAYQMKLKLDGILKLAAAST